MQKGFTIIELMIIVAVIAIVSVLGVPAMETIKSNRLADRLYQEIELDLRYARSQASSTGIIYEFEPLNDWDDGWKVTQKAAGGDVIMRQRNHELLSGTITSADLKTGSPLAFQPNGRSNNDVQIKIDVTGCSGDKIRTIQANRIGQIQITDIEAC
ncbi:GspH/FimT family pseudopilin [Thalassolituus sp. LLYu03]|uniref:GspH/FimT family pseudopilin n=1 Tax=Thalassolituus sp. LLYu03 TaxID=3421656 RepID=UPI003D2B1B3C